jgi:hypothetical protein
LNVRASVRGLRADYIDQELNLVLLRSVSANYGFAAQAKPGVLLQTFSHLAKWLRRASGSATAALGPFQDTLDQAAVPLRYINAGLHFGPFVVVEELRLEGFALAFGRAHRIAHAAFAQELEVVLADHPAIMIQMRLGWP